MTELEARERLVERRRKELAKARARLEEAKSEAAFVRRLERYYARKERAKLHGTVRGKGAT